jgi:hypothetical protein
VSERRVDIEQFRAQGYTILRGVVPKAKIQDALRLINGAFPRLGLRVEDRPREHDLTYFPDLIAHEVLLRLYKYAQPCVKEVIPTALSPTVCQLGLRFPSPEKELKPHIDGTLNRTYEAHFSVMASVFLSPARSGEGALWVWPGSHLALVKKLRKSGASLESLFATGRIPAPDGVPLPVEVEPGDVMLSHALLVHSAGMHYGPHVRYALYFRVRQMEQDELGNRILETPFEGFAQG